MNDGITGFSRPSAIPCDAVLRPPSGDAVVDLFAVNVPDLDARVARMKAAGVKVLEDLHPWGNMRAATTEEFNRLAIALVEAKQVETVNIERD